jgi:hypothetical protein
MKQEFCCFAFDTLSREAFEGRETMPHTAAMSGVNLVSWDLFWSGFMNKRRYIRLARIVDFRLQKSTKVLSSNKPCSIRDNPVFNHCLSIAFLHRKCPTPRMWSGGWKSSETDSLMPRQIMMMLVTDTDALKLALRKSPTVSSEKKQPDLHKLGPQSVCSTPPLFADGSDS